MFNKQDIYQRTKAVWEIIREKLAQRTVGSDNFSDVDFTSETHIRDFSLGNIHKLLYQIAGEGIIRGQLKNDNLLPSLLANLPKGYDDAIPQA